MPSLRIQKPLCPGTVYPAKIIGAVEKPSKAGNLMLELIVKVGDSGNVFEIRDYLVFTPNMIGRLTRFAEAIGLPTPQDEGETLSIEVDDCVGKRAQVELGNSERGNPKTGKPYLEITAWFPVSTGSAEPHPF
jgi:hypothetical protein